MIKKFIRIAVLFCLILGVNSAVYASPIDFDVTINCNEHLKKGELLEVFVDEKFVCSFEEYSAMNNHYIKGQPFYQGKTPIDSQQKSHNIKIKYIKDNQMIEEFNFISDEIIADSGKKLNATYHFNGSNIIEEKQTK